MNFKEFEKLIGKKVSEVNYILKGDLKKNLIEDSFYYTDLEKEQSFHNMFYTTITLVAEKDIVTSITIHLEGVVNRDFYDSFILDYGSPDTIHVIESKKVISEGVSKDNSFTQKITKSEVKLREGTFDENPLFITWKKGGYEIKILLRREQNTSDIIFSKLINN